MSQGSTVEECLSVVERQLAELKERLTDHGNESGQIRFTRNSVLCSD